MTSYSIAELEKLVQDGIKTIESLQQNPQDVQKTYGRSAIQKPSTRTRVDAWESYIANHDHSGYKFKGSQGSEEGANEDESSRNPGNHGGYGDESRSDRILPKTEKEEPDQQVWNAEDNHGDSGRSGRNSPSGLQQARQGGDSKSERDQEPEGYNPDGEVDAGEHRQIMLMDHEMSSVEIGAAKNYGMKIRNATTEDFAQVFNEDAPRVHRRLRGINTMIGQAGSDAETINPVKKGTAESTVSTLLGDVQLSGSGAIHNVHHSLLLQPSTDAHAEDAQSSVQDVQTTGFTVQSDPSSQDYKELERKIDIILNSLDNITKRLDMIPEIKEEIKNTNKKITNLSLGLSTIEGYIKSMMIIIPGSGKPDDGEAAEVNPDLKAVIGRDRTRGLKEVSHQRSTLENLEGGSVSAGVIEEQYITRPLNFTTSNASNFVPTNDRASYFTIVAMIKSEVKDIKKRQGLIDWFTNSLDEYDILDLYKMLREALDEYNSYTK
uniref:Phosphoprotein n=1 Tax=Otomys rat paramyxovirus TaxID=3141898 RepID=A0AAU7E448_9MONO